MNPLHEIFANLRISYIQELPGTLAQIESLILSIEVDGVSIEVGQELFRRVHSLKGSGGTYGLHAISAVCHHFEDLLTSLTEGAIADRELIANTSLVYVDLLYELLDVYRAGLDPKDDYIAKKLHEIDLKFHGKTFTAIIVDHSGLVRTLLAEALIVRKFRVLTLKDGYHALGRMLSDRVDVLITSLGSVDV